MKISANLNQSTNFGTLKYNMNKDPQDKLAVYAQYHKTSDEYQKLTQQLKDSDKVIIISDDYDDKIGAQIEGSKEYVQGPVMKVLQAMVKRISPDYVNEEKIQERRARKRF